MLADGDARLVEHRPQRLVALVVVVGEAKLGGVVGQLDGAGPDGGQPLDLGDGVLDVDDRQLVRHDQALRVDGGEVGEVVVERPGDGPPLVTDEMEAPEGAQLGVQHLGLDAVAVHVAQAGRGIVVAGALGTLLVERVHGQDLPGTHLRVRRGLHGERVVIGGDEPLRQPRPYVVGAHQHVRVR